MKSKKRPRRGQSGDFSDQVYRLASQIPSGRVSTYGAIAMALQRRGASRAVGMALHLNSDPPRIPCHRVVCRDGRIGGYAKGIEMKTQLLETEGVIVKDDRIQDFRKKIFLDFE